MLNANSTPLAQIIRDLRKRKKVTLQQLADRIERSIGFVSQIERGLSQPSVEDLHAIGLIAAGADESAGYYLGNYGEGILLALIDPGNGLPDAAPKPERVLTVVPQLISQFALDHRSLLRHYLQAKGFSVQETATEITGVQGATRVNAVLDAEGRISALHGSLAPSA